MAKRFMKRAASLKKWKFTRRVIALVLCVSMLAAMLPRFITASAAASDAFKTLYTREADENTMDSYVQASLGGFIYKDRIADGKKVFDGVDGVTTATVRNNYGTRYAGEVWADKSVFARYQPHIAQIRPFEEGKAYEQSRLKEVTDAGVSLPAGVAAGKALTAEQAKQLNESINGLMQKYYYAYDSENLKNGVYTPGGINNDTYKYTGDGDFNGESLVLERHTDGVNSTVTMGENSDFLHIFSALGSSQVINNNIELPLDVTIVLDTSSTMADTGTERRLYQASLALNQAFDAVQSNPYSRVSLVTFDTNAELYLPLDRYEPLSYQTDDEGNTSGVYFIGDNRFTSAEGGFFDQYYDSKDIPSLVRNKDIRQAKYYGSRTEKGEDGKDVVLATYTHEYSMYHRSQYVHINAKSATGKEEDGGTIPDNKMAATASVFVNHKDGALPDPDAPTGTLTLKNLVLGDAGEFAREEFTFTVTLDDETVDGTYGDMTFVDGVATVTLKHDESATAQLPVGVGYEVTQPGANAWKEYYYTTTAAGGRGIISASNTSTAVFVNFGYTDREELKFPVKPGADKDGGEAYPTTGNLVVVNAAADGTTDTADTTRFPFTVTLDDKSINGTYGGMTFTNGVARFELRNNEYKAAEGLPAGAAYTVKQTAQDGYTAETHYQEYADWFSVHAGTNTHQGLYEGLNMLLEQTETKTKVEVNGKTLELQRIPVVILVSDGEPSYVTTSSELAKRGSGQDVNNGVSLHTGIADDWWEPENPDFQYAKTTGRANLIGYPSGRGWGCALPVFLMAAHMKQKLNEHYFGSASPQNYPGTQIVTVGVDSAAEGGTFNEETNKWSGDMRRVGLMKITLDPTEWLSDDAYQESLGYYQSYAAEGKSFEDVSNDPESIYVFTKHLYEAVNRYLNPKDTLADLQLGVDWYSHYMTIARPDAADNVYPIDWDGVRYNDRYLDTTSEDLGQVLQDLVADLKALGTVFTPVSGTNAAGTSDALTYVDPIGDYMIVDGVTDVTVFGEQYKVKKRAVYDYQVNEALLAQGFRESSDPTSKSYKFIRQGWYQEKDDGTYLGPDKAPKNKSNEEMWNDGWVYRITYYTAQQFVPTLPEPDDTRDRDEVLTDKQKNTVFTIYSITEQYQRKDPNAESDYGDKWTIDKSKKTVDILEGDSKAARESRTRPNLSYSSADDADVTFDLLSDIRIWVEDSGDWQDEAEGGFVVDSDYSQALYLNISANALPVQVAQVDLNLKEGTGIRYSTNLNDTYASTPLRVYYGVSVDPDYLRYDEEGTPTGVAMSDMSMEYLSANTGSDFTVHGEKNGVRYTALYSNYFSNSFYNEYPVTTDNTAVSRGNAAVTFAPSADNQFYRFQKNRVLFLIPGTYGSHIRPAEIDLGDIREKWLGTVNIQYDVAKTNEDGSPVIGADDKVVLTGDSQIIPSVRVFSSREDAEKAGAEDITPVDPDNFEHLLAVINYSREASAESGTHSPYWVAGDCVAVDGGSDLAIQGADDSSAIEANFRRRISKLSKAERDAVLELRKDINSNFSAAQLTTQPQISSDNWYYIVREFYYPVFEGSQSGSTDNVEVHYMAIGRAGSEFGSGLANGEGMGSEIEWYNVETKEVDAFTADANSHYGYDQYTDTDGVFHPAKGTFKYIHENEDGTIYENDIEEGSIGHTHEGSWYVSARPGGLRVGGMANFVGTKGYDIREGTDKRDFQKDGAVIAKSNVTERALTYFLPAVSSFTDEETSTDAVINLYLGNNGRALVEESTLLVTKTVNNMLGEAGAGGQDEQFEFEVDIEGYYGVRRAGLITRDEFNSSLWRRRFQSIDVITDNHDLLMGEGGGLAVVTRSGRRVIEAEIQTEEDIASAAAGNTAYYYTERDEFGNLVRDENGNIAPKYEEGMVTEPLYYVYVGENITADYGRYVLRVFEADVTKNDSGEIIRSNLYGNLTQRGGRNFYVNGTTQEIDELNREQGSAKAKFLKSGVDNSTGVNITREEGDREYWISTVYLVPKAEVDSARKEDEESRALTDWAWPCDPQLKADSDYSEAEKVGCVPVSNFVVATLRASDETGSTSATELVSDHGFALRTSYMSTQVNFSREKNARIDSDYYGKATVWLKDGEGLLFNGIGDNAWYTVTEKLNVEKQSDRGIRFQEVSHVQDGGIRTTYVYDPDGNRQGADKVDVKNAIIQPSDKYVGAKNCYILFTDKEQHDREYPYCEGGYDERVGATDIWRHYFLRDDGTRDNSGSHAEHTNANFEKAQSEDDPDADRPETYDYTIIGTTGASEEAVHVVNFVPDVAKVEFSPGAEESVYVRDRIDYGIRWENFAYSVHGGQQSAPVTITDPLDDGVDFVSATFNPYHSTIYSEPEFNESEYLKRGPAEVDKSHNKVLDTSVQAVGGRRTVTQHYEPLSKDDEFDPFDVIITYDENSHTVEWTILNAPAGASGYVELSTRVNSTAIQPWEYQAGSPVSGRPVADGEADFKVVNCAGVTVGNFPQVATDIITNYTGDPHKSEDDPGNGMQVMEGQEVTYTIDWTNYKKDSATVIIEDRLDPGVDFERAWIDGNTFDGAAGGRVTLLSDLSKLIVPAPADPAAPGGESSQNGSAESSGPASAVVPEEPVESTVSPDVSEVGSAVEASEPAVPEEPVESSEPDAPEEPVESVVSPDVSEVGSALEASEPAVPEEPVESAVSPDASEPDDPGSLNPLAAEYGMGEGTVLLGHAGETPQTVTVKITYDETTRVITWRLENAPKLYSGTVSFTVKVNENADYKWKNDPTEVRHEASYPDDANGDGLSTELDLTAEKDYRIYNRARVRVDEGRDDKWQDTNIVANPTKPEKAEPDPGDGKDVVIGQEITYTVTWKNTTLGDSTVVITDNLDPGVTFLAAGFMKKNPVEGKWEESAELPDAGCAVSHTVDGDGHSTVTWTLPNRGPGAYGMVWLRVTANVDARQKWTYDPETGLLRTGSAGQADDMIYNMAMVKVGEISQATDIVSNHVAQIVNPKKLEVTPGEGVTVEVGNAENDAIEYTVSWKNDAYLKGEYVASTVVITDRLDYGVDLVEVGFMEPKPGSADVFRKGDHWRWDAKAAKWASAPPALSDRVKATVEYSLDQHAVRWTLTERGPESNGEVYLIVRVNEAARMGYQYREGSGYITPGDDFDDMVYNKAQITVTNGSDQLTDVVENPVLQEAAEEPPVSSEPESSEPESSEPDVSSEPGESSEVSREPEESSDVSSKPESGEPESSEPESSKPESGEPESSKPESGESESSKPATPPSSSNSGGSGGSGGGEAPQTGDESRLILWMLLLNVSLFGLGGTGYLLRKRIAAYTQARHYKK